MLRALHPASVTLFRLQLRSSRLSIRHDLPRFCVRSARLRPARIPPSPIGYVTDSLGSSFLHPTCPHRLARGSHAPDDHAEGYTIQFGFHSTSCSILSYDAICYFSSCFPLWSVCSNICSLIVDLGSPAILNSKSVPLFHPHNYLQLPYFLLHDKTLTKPRGRE